MSTNFILYLFPFCYVLLMGILWWGYYRIPEIKIKSVKPKTAFSILIPFRNEAENLSELLASLSKLKYPSYLFEIIFIDDASQDNSVAIIESFITSEAKENWAIIPNARFTKSPKKDAITAAIQEAKNEWIVTTDADCELPKNWLKTLDSFIQKENVVCIAAPVLYKSNNSVVAEYQQLDGLSLQLVTMGFFGLNNPLLCNGANFAYKKAAFKEVNGFTGNFNIASGDDVFLLQKIKKQFPDQTLFIKSKEAIVLTKSQPNFKAVINQRIRWASKITSQKSTITYVMGGFIYSINAFLLIAPIIILIHPKLVWVLITLALTKICMDYFVLKSMASFFNVDLKISSFVSSFLIYLFITPVVTIGSIYGSYQWKDRYFKANKK